VNPYRTTEPTPTDRKVVSHMIDISSCQPDTRIEWNAVALAKMDDGEPILGVIVKATDGNGGADPDFAPHVRGIRSTDALRIAHGLRPLLVCAYHFDHPDPSKDDAVAEANHFIDVCDAVGGPFAFYMLDSEEARRIANGGPFVDWHLAFYAACEARTGRLTVQYTGGPFFNEHAGNIPIEKAIELARRPLCLAAYVANPTIYVPHPWKTWAWHQRSGDQAPGNEKPLHVPGIDGGRVNVDHDVFNGPREAVYAWVDSLVIPVPHEPAPTQPETAPNDPYYVDRAELDSKPPDTDKETPTARSSQKLAAVNAPMCTCIDDTMSIEAIAARASCPVHGPPTS